MLLKTEIGIKKWLEKYGIFNYELIPDEKYGYIVNINNPVFLGYNNFKSIDIKFNIINGYFDCSNNKLESLEGCPKIVNGGFNCASNKLTSLEYCPTVIKGDFFCDNNKLTSLVGCPKIINGDFDCSNNENLDSLIFYPKIIVGELDLFNCNLNLDGLINLEFIDVQSNYIDLRQNKELNNLNDIANVNELKEIVKIYKEKSAIMRFVEKKDFNIVNTVIINKSIKQINKI